MAVQWVGSISLEAEVILSGLGPCRERRGRSPGSGIVPLCAGAMELIKGASEG